MSAVSGEEMSDETSLVLTVLLVVLVLWGPYFIPWAYKEIKRVIRSFRWTLNKTEAGSNQSFPSILPLVDVPNDEIWFVHSTGRLEKIKFTNLPDTASPEEENNGDV